MTPPWGINWQRYHADQQDMPHIAKMGYRSFTIYEWMWNNRDFCNELLSVARKDAIFLDRDHPLSEQKDDQWINDPSRKGRNHADEWAQKVKDGKVFTPLDRTYFLGLNEPDSNKYQRQIDAYNEAYCRRMAEHGLRAAAYSFGVGHPSTVDLRQDTPPDWSWYAASAAAILEGHHLAATHEYGAPQVDGYGWEFWCNRISFCPYPFDVVYDECGIDNGVLQSGILKGWSEFMSGEQYCRWLDGFQVGMAERAHTRKVKVLSYNIFGYDHGSSDSKDWHSFDIRPIRPLLEAFQWTQVATSTTPPHPTHLPQIGDGPTPPAKPQPFIDFDKYLQIVTTVDANIRKQPSLDGEIIKVLPAGTQLNAVGETGNWYGAIGGGADAFMVSEVFYIHKTVVKPVEQPTPTTPAFEDNWARCLAYVLRWEGGWADDPNDVGGATMKGITLATYTRWRAEHGQPPPTKDDLRNITDEEVNRIYYEKYWRASGAHELPWPLCLAQFDTSVNAGVGKALEMLRKSDDNFQLYVGYAGVWYTGLADFEHFGRAWARRRFELLIEASKT